MEWSEILAEQGRLFGDAARQVPDATVPNTPEWTTVDLVRHVTFLHSRIAAAVRNGDVENPLRRDDALPAPPKREAALDVYDANLADVVSALRDSEPDRPVGTFMPGPPVTAAWWGRRMAHEMTVHRVDVEDTAGVERSPIDPALAIDGIDELFAFSGAMPDAEASGPTVHLHATDVEGEWLATLGDDGTLHVERGHAKGDVAVRGPATDLYLWAWRRVPLDTLETFGDRAVAERLSERVKR